MSFESSDPQECYFYQGRWNEENVNLFIRLLLDNVKQVLWLLVLKTMGNAKCFGFHQCHVGNGVHMG